MTEPSDHMTLSDAVAIAAQAHREDLWGGEPYVLHPIRVMMRVEGESARMTAILHDVVEDHAEDGWTFEELERRGCPTEVLEALRLVTHEKPEGDRNDPAHIEAVKVDYAAYVNRLAGNPVARVVKLADLAENIGDADWAEGGTPWRKAQLERYLTARERLQREA